MKARKAKETITDTAAAIKEAVGDKMTAEEISLKKNARKAGRKARETLDQVMDQAVKKTEPNIIIQSPMGGVISAEEIAKKVPQDTADVYVRVDENKLYYVVKNGESGAVNIWD